MLRCLPGTKLSGVTLSGDLYMSADQAAEALGVSITTLYTYVSRKQIRSKRMSGTRQRLYWRADIERVRGGAGAAPNLAMVGVRQDTDITLLTPTGPYYRGESALVLSDTHSLEQISARLWQVDEKTAFRASTAKTPPEMRGLLRILCKASSIDKAIALFPFIEQANPLAYDLSHAGMSRTGAELLRWYASILTNREQPSSEPLHEQVARYLKCGVEAAHLIRRLLVLSADHGFGAGAYAVRAVASTGVSPYRSVIAGMAIVTGRHTKFGRIEAIARLLSEVSASADPQSAIVRRLRQGEQIPGFDSPSPYGGAGDPRAERLLEHLRQVFGDHRAFVKTGKAIDIAESTLKLHPSFALVIALLNQIIGVPSGRVLYILGRCVGWVAHSIEQYEVGAIEVPIANYKGSLPAPA